MIGLVVLAALVSQPRDTLTLERALLSARQLRPQHRALGAGSAEARARAGVAGSIPNPVLQYKHAEASPVGEAYLEQRLDWLLARWPERSAGLAGVRAARADSARQNAELEREVRLAFYSALAAGHAHTLAEGNATSADSLARFAARRVAAGDLSVFEREHLEVEAGRLRQFLSRAQEAKEAARAALVRATGHAAAGSAVLAGGLDAGLDTTWPARPSLDELPLLQRAAADSAAAHARLQATNFSRLPIPSLILGRKWDDGSPFDGGANAIVGFSVPVPLWNIGSARAGVAHAQAQHAAAAAGEARLEAERLLNDHESRLHQTRARALFARDTLLPRARRLRDGAVRLYQAGQTGVLPVFDALRAEREVALGYIQDLLAWQAARSDWLVLLGKTS